MKGRILEPRPIGAAIGLALVVAFAWTAGGGSHLARAATTLPNVLPNLQQWQAGSGTGFAWSASSRIVVNSADASALSADAQTFASDLALDLDGPAPAVVTGASTDAQPGDIFEALGSTDTQLGSEGYGLTVGPVLQLSARTATGVFWGTRTVLQLLRQATALPAGTARDWPVYAVRDELISNTNYPLSWWFNEIRDLSYLKLNEVWLPVNDNPMPAAQLQQVDAFARRYHVTFVPENDMPGHMDPDLPAAFTLTDSANNLVTGALDLTNPQAVAWAKQQVLNQIDLFSGSLWHMGGDEYPLCCGEGRIDNPTAYPKLVDFAHQQFGPNATADDLYRDFANQIDTLVHQHGKSLRMWNDVLFTGGVVPLNSDIGIEDWFIPGSDSQSAAQMAAGGNQLVNANRDFLYFDQHSPDFPNTTAQTIWEQFDPGEFNAGQRLPGGDTDPHLAGIKLSEWNVMNEAAGLLERDLEPLHRALAQKAWGSPELFPTWAQMQAAVDAVGQAPGFVATPAAGDPGAGSLPGSRSIVFGSSQNAFLVQPDGSLVHAYWQTGQGCCALTETLAGAGSVAGQPIAFTSPDFGGQQHVFARGTDGHLHHWWTAGVAGGWQTDDWTAKAAANGFPSLDVAGDPAGFSYGNQQHVFAMGSDGHLHHWWWPNADPVHADDWGGSLTGTPLADVWGSLQQVFARSSDGTLHHWWWQPTDPDYVHQESWGGQLASDASPAGYDYTETQQHVYARDPGGHLLHWTYDIATGQVQTEDLTTVSGVAVAGDPTAFTYTFSGQLQQHVFARGAADGHLHHLWRTPTTGLENDDWTAKAAGSPVNPAGNPSGFDFQNAEQHVFALDSGGNLHHWFWLQSNNTVNQDTWIAAPGAAPAACGDAAPCTQQTFADAVFAYPGIGAPVMAANESAFEVWERAEGGNWNNTASCNPLNTTQPEPGSTSINSAGVRAYHDSSGHTCWGWGIKATGDTLENGHYGAIINALRSPAADARTQCINLARAVGSTPWGTGDFEADC